MQATPTPNAVLPLSTRIARAIADGTPVPRMPKPTTAHLRAPDAGYRHCTVCIGEGGIERRLEGTPDTRLTRCTACRGKGQVAIGHAAGARIAGDVVQMAEAA